MVQKKICMLGATAVGKTSLVARYVRNLFSEKYHSSIGVKVDKKVLSAGGQEMTLLLWDIYGDDEFQRIRTSYLRGASGYLLVVDGTRRSTLDRALEIKKGVADAIGQVPFVLVVNKADLVDEWDMPENLEDQFRKQGWDVIRSSAKTGMGVEEAFSGLAAKLAAA